MLHETFKRKKRYVNLIAYNVLESSSSSIPEQFVHDYSNLGKILMPLGGDFLSCSKLVRLEIACSNGIHPLKIIYNYKKKVMLMLSGFHDAKRSGSVF